MPGVAACPPYHVGIAVGGTSPEIALKAAKLAAAGYYDGLSDKPLAPGGIFRSPYWERKLLSIADKSGLGAQFGGKYFANSATVLRLPRHAASCHVGMAVSCVAHRRISAYVGRDGVFLEKLDANPERFADKVASLSFAEAPLIRLDRPICEIRKELSQLPPGTRLRLSGPMIVARDSACMRMAEELASSGQMPECVRDAVVYHAGPARTPPGMPCGSFGPTTAQRMDPYLDRLMNAGAFLITLAKGDRGATARDAFRKHGAFYLGTIGGAAALIAQRHVLSSEIVGYEDLGMEALRRIVVNDLPAFVICDDKGASFYDHPTSSHSATVKSYL